MGTIFALFVELTPVFAQHHLCYNQAVSSTEITNAKAKERKNIFSFVIHQFLETTCIYQRLRCQQLGKRLVDRSE